MRMTLITPILAGLFLAVLLSACGGGGTGGMDAGVGGAVFTPSPDATPITLQWPVNPESEDVTRYTLEVADEDNTPVTTLLVPVLGSAARARQTDGWYTFVSTDEELGMVRPGTYSITIMAHNAAGASEPSPPNWIAIQ